MMCPVVFNPATGEKYKFYFVLCFHNLVDSSVRFETIRMSLVHIFRDHYKQRILLSRQAPSKVKLKTEHAQCY